MGKLADGINFLNKLTLRRGWNGLKLFGSFYLSRLTGRPTHHGMPVSVSIEPTTSCNLRCPECPSGLRAFDRPTGMLQMPLYQQMIDQLHRETMYMTLYFQGEPYLHPQFFDLVSYASSKKMYVATSTNAHYLTDEKARQTVESGLSRLIISIDGTSQDVYQQYRRGGSLEKVLEGTRNVVKWKKELKSRTPHIIFQFLVVRPNEHQIEDVKRLGREAGVDEVKFKTAQLYNFKHGNELMPKNERYSRYRQLPDGTYEVKNGLDNHCWRMWQGCVITWDGLVVPCCFDKDAQHRLGDMKRIPFRDIWNGSEYRNFREALMMGRDQIDICRNCTEGTKVWA